GGTADPTRPAADAQGTDAQGADAHGADVHGADVHGADVHGADLRAADGQAVDGRPADGRAGAEPGRPVDDMADRSGLTEAGGAGDLPVASADDVDRDVPR